MSRPNASVKHEKGYISDPANKNKSVRLTDEGAKLSEELFEKLFGLHSGINATEPSER